MRKNGGEHERMEVDSAARMVLHSRVKDVHEHPVTENQMKFVQLAAHVGEGRRKGKETAYDLPVPTDPYM
jgi:hypothetical protein